MSEACGQPLPGLVSIPREWEESGGFLIFLLDLKEVGGKQNCLSCREPPEAMPRAAETLIPAAQEHYEQ